ncbi:MAG: response regulator [Geminicoccaceae bacterium]
MDQRDSLQERVGSETPKLDSIHDSVPEPALDRIVSLASNLFGTPIAAILSTVDGSVRCEALHGLENAEILGKSAICIAIVSRGDPLIMDDTRENRQFQNDPLVISSPGIRFCAGVPLSIVDGRPTGALILADTQPRQTLSAPEIERLKGFAALSADVLSLCETSRAPDQPPAQSPAFLASMSHDLRTPMNGVLGMAELLLTADDLSDRHRRRIEIIRRSGTTLLETLDHLIELSKIHSEVPALKSSPLDLRELLLKASSQLQSENLGKSIKFDLVDTLDDHHRVSGDGTFLRQLFSAFFRSGADVANEPLLRVTASAQPLSSEQVQVCLAIELTASDAEALGNQFASLGRDEHLAPDSLAHVRNLMICRSMAESMGGSMALDHRTNEMSVFRIDFSLDADSSPDPMSSAREHPRTTCPASGPSGGANAIRDVLVAEDDPDMALLIEDLLDEAGYRATLAPDGASALEFIDQRSFDVVLMDGRLPDMTGFEATAAIRNLPDDRAKIPIIALTGEALIGDRERYLSAGMDDYIAKPVSYATLVDTIERCHCEQR